MPERPRGVGPTDRDAPDVGDLGGPLTAFLAAVPDAVVLVDAAGRIVKVNRQACALFGYGEADLLGRPVEVLLPESLRDRHVEHRDRYTRDPLSRPMAEGQDLYARHRDGRDIPVDIGLAPMRTTDGSVVAAFVRDATVRRRATDARQRLHDAEIARRHALEVNDNVLQGLTTAIWQLDIEDPTGAVRTLDQTLEASRQMVADLLDSGAPGVAPGDLVRAQPAPTSVARIPQEPREHSGGRIRVLLADDSADVRMLLRARLSKLDDLEVVAEAADGLEALALVEQLRPDVIVLDLSMPLLDGLEAAEELRTRHPDLRIVVLSGYPTDAMRALALAAGADEYVEKGPDLGAVEEAIRLRAVS